MGGVPRGARVWWVSHGSEREVLMRAVKVDEGRTVRGEERREADEVWGEDERLYRNPQTMHVVGEPLSFVPQLIVHTG